MHKGWAMTLILGLAAVDGIVLASDGQLTSGEVRSPGRKIFPLNDKILWAGAGELSLIQRLQERLARLPLDTPLANLRDQIGEYIKECVSELLQMDFRAQFVSAEQDHLVQLHLADFMINGAVYGELNTFRRPSARPSHQPMPPGRSSTITPRPTTPGQPMWL